MERLKEGGTQCVNRVRNLSGASGPGKDVLDRSDAFVDLRRDAEDRIVEALEGPQLCFGKAHIIARNFDIVIVL